MEAWLEAEAQDCSSFWHDDAFHQSDFLGKLSENETGEICLCRAKHFTQILNQFFSG